MKESEIINAIRQKFGIESLNPMQKKMAESTNSNDVILLSPTGSGKTIAFTIPMLKNLRASNGRVQAIVIAPSRELTIQIAKVVQAIASEVKVTCCYGGHNFEDEKNSLSVVPDIIVSTPDACLTISTAATWMSTLPAFWFLTSSTNHWNSDSTMSCRKFCAKCPMFRAESLHRQPPLTNFPISSG